MKKSGFPLIFFFFLKILIKKIEDEISQTATNCLLFVNMYSQEDLLSYKNFLSELKNQLMGIFKFFHTKNKINKKQNIKLKK